MNYRHKILCFLCFLLGATIQAQQTWSLDDCVAYAVKHNLQIKGFEYTEQSNKESYKQSIRSLLPSVSAFTNYRINFGRSIDPNTNVFVNTEFVSNNYSLDAQIDLFQGFQKVNTIKATKFLYKAAFEETLHQKYLLAFRVMSAFYDIQFMEGLYTISKEQKEVSQENYDLVKKQVEIGQKAKADLYEAESALLADQLLVTQSKNNVEAAKLALIQQMNLENATTISILTIEDKTSELLEESESNKDSIFNKAKNFIPIVKAQELRVEAAKKQLAATRGGLYPSIGFSAGYSSRYVDNNLDEDTGELIPFNTQIKDNAAQFVGVSLAIPITNAWASRSRVKQQKVAMMRAENDFNVQKQEIYQIIQQLLQDRNALKGEYEQSEQRAKAQKLAFDIAQKRYEKGLISIIELNQSKNTLANAQNEFLQVQLRSKINKSTLDFYRGLPVFNLNRVQ
ncbi:TolC family protein [Aquimarina sp. D1M17]|uniref:TolC family protein n=1 Tax=Aquimarina acroporae TaxID=2937283 RepID=UPI0020BE5705|nr:TolC family protein [Aquimarina acroporae]MCK8523167.1 TolC family protein [Aquimarina acroporae]